MGQAGRKVLQGPATGLLPMASTLWRRGVRGSVMGVIMEFSHQVLESSVVDRSVRRHGIWPHVNKAPSGSVSVSLSFWLGVAVTVQFVSEVSLERIGGPRLGSMASHTHTLHTNATHEAASFPCCSTHQLASYCTQSVRAQSGTNSFSYI